jgi:hypothetical protein
MSGPFLRLEVDRQIRLESEWPSKPFTLRRCARLVTLWCMCIIMPPVVILAGAFYGAIVGTADGAMQGLREVHRDLVRWWNIFDGG